VSGAGNGVISEHGVGATRYPNGNIKSITVSGVGVSRTADLQWAVEWYQADLRRASGVSDRWRNFGTTPGLPFRKTAIAPNQNIVSAVVKVRVR